MSEAVDNASPPSLESNREVDNPPQAQNTSARSTQINVDNEGEQEAITRHKKLTSSVWQYFERKKIGGQIKAICKECKKALAGHGTAGTSHLRAHLDKTCPKRRNKSISDMHHQYNLKVEGVQGQTISGEKVTVVNYTFDQERSRRDLVKMIIAHEYPLSMVEHKFFRKFMSSVQPNFKVISRNTIRNDILYLYGEWQAKTSALLKKNHSRIAITTDMWTAQTQKKGFMAITAHWIDDDWKLQSRVLRFAYVPNPHTSESLANALMKTFVHWSIEKKLSTLTMDNCSTNDGVISFLKDKLEKRSMILRGDLFHMRCAAHILNLIVQEGLQVISVGIERIRDSVSFWSAKSKRVQKFEECANQADVSYTKKLALDCKTRWNSTFLMLQTALMYKDVFSRLNHIDRRYKTCPNEDDWIMATEICEKLELFYKVTKLFSGSQYPTANIFFEKICSIKITLTEWTINPSEVIRSMAFNMMQKFDKYWTSINGILTVATILDPRYKIDFLECCWSMMYGVDERDLDVKINGAKKICYDLLSEYQERAKRERENVSTSSRVDLSNSISYMTESSSIHGGIKDMNSIYDQFLSKRKKYGNSSKSELDYYLEEDVLPRVGDFDILSWWKSNGPKYPTLQAIARDIYAIPISTVASESAFSTSGRIISPQRNKLTSQLVEALMCCRDWIWAEEEDSSKYQLVRWDNVQLGSFDEDEDKDQNSQSSTVFIEED